MATITELPDDVIAIILENEGISMEDIENLTSTCERFHQIILPNKFWEKKYYQSCPTAKRKYNKEKQNKIFHHIDFKERIEEGLYYNRKLQYYAFVASENLNPIDKIGLTHLLRSIAENSMTYYSVWDETNKISAQKSCKLFINLTHEYIFQQIFHCLRYFRFIHKQMKFKKMRKRKLLLEKQLTIVAQHFAPHVSYSAVKTWLDGITERVLSRVKDKYPNHSICSTTLEYFSFWRDNNIDDNFWNETESKQIMCVLEEYIFSELEIDELYESLKLTDIEVKCINYIAECFRKHLLIITYHIIARRLGIHTRLIKYFAFLGVIWKPKYNTSRWYNAEFFYITPIRNSDLFYPSNIIRGIYQSGLFSMPLFSDIWITFFTMRNFYTELKDHNKYCKWNFYIIFNFLRQCRKPINIESKYKIIMNTIEIKFDPVEKKLKRRTENVKFAVGMIVTYPWRDRFRHDVINGVIIGWDHNCFSHSNRFITPPDLRRCSKSPYICNCQTFSDSQKHYTILTERNDICYVRQGKLSICPPKEIDNMEIGRYFSSFEGTHYVPNEYLRKYYPEDTAAIARILAEQ